MTISNSRKYIFVHIHKTGGISVAQALYSTIPWNGVLCVGPPFGEAMNRLYSPHFGIWKHSHAREIKAMVGDEV